MDNLAQNVVYGKVASDLLNSLNSRRYTKILLSVFFTFYILNFWVLVLQKVRVLQITGIIIFFIGETYNVKN